MNVAGTVRKPCLVAHVSGRVMLLTLGLFLGVSATVGGIGLLLDWWGSSLDWLDGSPFADYTIPGLALIAVRASAVLSALLLLRSHPLRLPVAAVAGITIVIYELVEVAVVPFHWLQVFYVAVGLVIVLLTERMWAAEHAHQT